MLLVGLSPALYRLGQVVRFWTDAPGGLIGPYCFDEESYLWIVNQ